MSTDNGQRFTVNRPSGFIFYLSLMIYLPRMFFSPTDYSDFFTHYASVFLSPQRGHTLVVTAGNPTVGRLPADSTSSLPPSDPKGVALSTINPSKNTPHQTPHPQPSKKLIIIMFFICMCATPIGVGGDGGGFLLSAGGSFSTRPPTVTTSYVSFGDLLPVFLRPFDQP